MRVSTLIGRATRQKVSHGTGLKTIFKRCQSTASEYLEEAVYPPAEDFTIDPKLIEKKEWHKKLTGLPTYEQKMMELNMPKYYGFYCCLLNDKEFQVNALPFLKFITRTDVLEGLPSSYYSDVSESSSSMAEILAPHVESLIAMHFGDSVYRSEADNEVATQDFLNGLHRLLSSCITSSFTTSLDPRIHGFWFAGSLFNWGRDRPEWMHYKEERRDVKLWTKNLWLDEEEPYKGDVCMRSYSTPMIGCRETHGLPQVEDRVRAAPSVEGEDQLEKLERLEEKVPESEKKDKDGKLPASHSYFDRDPNLKDDRLNPKVYGYSFDHKRANLIPGFWSGDSHQHWRVFYHNRSYLDDTAKTFAPYNLGNNPLHQKLIISSHTQGISQAAMLGFSPVTELTYPIVQQNVVSDGKRFNLSLHQLNTMALHSENTVENETKNKIWVSPEMQLYDRIDANGKVHGLNKELLSKLACLYSKKCLERENSTPYLGEIKYLWNHPAKPEFRHIFHKNLLHKFSERPPEWPKPEMYLWERIYKVEFDRRHRDAKKKFYEGHWRRLLPSDRTGLQMNPKDLRTAPRPRGRKRYIRSEPPKVDTEELCVEIYDWFYNKYWYR